MHPQIPVSEKDQQRLQGLANVVKVDPEKALELIEFAYGLGFCHGREMGVKEMLAVVESRTSLVV